MPTGNSTASSMLGAKLKSAEDALSQKTDEAARLRSSVEFLYGLLERAKQERTEKLDEIKALHSTIREKDEEISNLQTRCELEEKAFGKVLSQERAGFERRLNAQRKQTQEREQLLALWVEGAIRASIANKKKTIGPAINQLIEKTSANLASAKQAVDTFKAVSANDDSSTVETDFLQRLKKFKFNGTGGPSVTVTSPNKEKGKSKKGKSEEGGHDVEEEGNDGTGDDQSIGAPSPQKVVLRYEAEPTMRVMTSSSLSSPSSTSTSFRKLPAPSPKGAKSSSPKAATHIKSPDRF